MIKSVTAVAQFLASVFLVIAAQPPPATLSPPIRFITPIVPEWQRPWLFLSARNGLNLAPEVLWTIGLSLTPSWYDIVRVPSPMAILVRFGSTPCHQPTFAPTPYDVVKIRSLRLFNHETIMVLNPSVPAIACGVDRLANQSP